MWGLVNAVKQFFNAITVLFGAFGKGAEAIDHLASVAKTHADLYQQEADIEAKKRMLILNRELAALQAQAPVPALANQQQQP